MQNYVISYFKIEQFKSIRFDSEFQLEALEYKSFNSHRVIFRLRGNGEPFTEKELEKLRKEIKQNLSLSWVGNFAFHLVLHDFTVTDEFHYQMVDWRRRSGGACLWAVVIDHANEQATGVHGWQQGGMSQIYENILEQYPDHNGAINAKYKTPPNIVRWGSVIHFPWLLFDPKNRPWNPQPRFCPPFDHENTVQKYEGVVGFGYKNIWYAFHSEDPLEVAEALGIMNTRKVNWETGVDAAYQNGIFITPPIGGWVLAVGRGLSDMSQMDENEKKQLESWSKKFGEVQFFATHRGVEAHCWIKAINGIVVRAYSYIGESGETLLNLGTPTPVEQPFNLIDTNLPEAQEEGYWEREDVKFPNEEMVMKIAADWSVDPTELENREGIPLQGLLAVKGKKS